MLELQVLAEDWRIEYNTYRTHGSLGFHRIPAAMDPPPERNPTNALISPGTTTGFSHYTNKSSTG